MPVEIQPPFDDAWLEQSVPAVFEQQVALYPNHLAVKSGDQALSYAELNRAANRLARAILAELGPGQEPVAVFVEHGAASIVAILAVVKAGKIYLPLDPSFPLQRTAPVLSESQARLVLVSGRSLGLAAGVDLDGLRLLNVAEIDPTLDDGNLGLQIPPDAYLNVLYTSGTTGRPKGVLDSHRNALHMFFSSRRRLPTGPGDRLTLVTSPSFAASTGTIFGALLSGAALLPFDLKEQGLVSLARWMHTEEISVYHSVPTVFRQLVAVLDEGEIFPSVRIVKLGSEPVLRRDIELIRRHFPAECLFSHSFGTTETHVIAWNMLNKDSPLEGAVIPAGYPVEDKTVLLLGEDGQPVAAGEAGEIVVKSRYLSPGYWRQPELSAARFQLDPQGGPERIYRTGDLGRLRPDGSLEHLGRKDFQVKIRGQRVDTAEIELALMEMPGVRQAAVAAREAAPGDKRLVVYLVPGIPTPEIPALRTALAARFPAYMLPSAYVLLECLPQLPFGKVDRSALPTPDWARQAPQTEYVAPRSPLEASLVAIWAAALGLPGDAPEDARDGAPIGAPRIGVQHNFAELGGHSLLAAQVTNTIREELSLDLPVRAIFEAPTVAELAAWIERAQAEAAAATGEAERSQEKLAHDLRLLGSF